MNREFCSTAALIGVLLLSTSMLAQQADGPHPPNGCQLLGDWQGAKEKVTVSVAAGSYVLSGTRRWNGTYDTESGLLQVSHTLSEKEKQAEEDKHKVPQWARDLVAREKVKMTMRLTVVAQKDPAAALQMTGEIFGEKVEWSEDVDTDTNQPILASRKAWITADADQRQELGYTLTKDAYQYDSTGESKHISDVRADRRRYQNDLTNALKDRPGGAGNTRTLNGILKEACAQMWDWAHSDPVRHAQDGILRRDWELEIYRDAWLHARNETCLSNAAAHAYAQSKLDEWSAQNLEDFMNMMNEHLQQMGSAISAQQAVKALEEAMDEILRAADASRRAQAMRNTVARAKAQQQVQCADLDEELIGARNRTGVPKATNGKVTGGTVAVSKSNVRGLDQKVYTGKSGSLYDEWPWEKGGVYESENPVGQHHAEGDLANQWEQDLRKAFPGDGGYSASGDIELHVEQPLCGSCGSGLNNGDAIPGVIGQFSQNHPNIDIHITNSADPNGTVLVVRAGVVVAKSFPVPGGN